MSVSYTASDTVVLARRNLKRIPRQPDLLEQAPDAGRGTGTHDGTEGEDGRQR